MPVPAVQRKRQMIGEADSQTLSAEESETTETSMETESCHRTSHRG